MNQKLQKVFGDIFMSNKWGSSESQSGSGSELTSVGEMLPKLQALLDKLGVESLLDIPCGDCNWARHLKVKKYIGADIVSELIAANQSALPKKRFLTLDVTSDDIPKCDAVLCRDLLGHFSVENAKKALMNIKRSGAKWLITTTFPKWQSNPNAKDGGWYPINLEYQPFNLKSALLLNEGCKEGGGIFKDKSLALFDLEKMSLGAIKVTTKRLTIGLPVFDDYEGTFFTIQSLRMHHREVMDQVQLLVVDSNPDSDHGKATKHFCEGTGVVKYVEERIIKGTAPVKNLIFQHAETEFVMCLDCHVLLESGSIAKLLKYFEQDEGDLLHGPMLYDDLKTPSTCMDLRWQGGMWGMWGTDKRGLNPKGKPFEIPAQGMGLFACRKDKWLGFHLLFKGFGAEECYIHEKFRKHGKKAMCLPFLRWSHRFNRPGGARYSSPWEDRIFNYFIGFMELGFDLDPIIHHFSAIVPYDSVMKTLSEAEKAMKQ